MVNRLLFLQVFGWACPATATHTYSGISEAAIKTGKSLLYLEVYLCTYRTYFM
jgi:hypothetical protein